MQLMHDKYLLSAYNECFLYHRSYMQLIYFFFLHIRFFIACEGKKRVKTLRETAKREKTNKSVNLSDFRILRVKIPSVNSLNPSKTIRVFFENVCKKKSNFLPIHFWGCAKLFCIVCLGNYCWDVPIFFSKQG